MKVLHITNNFPTENYPIFGIFVKEQIDSLTAQGVDNEIFFINGREGGKSAYIESIGKLRKKLKQEKYDIVHCHHALSALIFLLTLRFRKTKKIVSYQNDPEREGGKYLFILINYFFDAIILKNIKGKVSSSKISYLPNGVNIDFFKPIDRVLCCEKLQLDFKKKYILFFDSNKGKRTQKRFDKFEETMNLLKRKGFNDIEQIVLTNTKRELIPYYMNVAELHLLCSDFEGSPNSVKECMSCNTKVVSTNVGNVEDLFDGAEGYFISQTNQVKDILNSVELAIGSKIVNGRDIIIEKKLDIESVAIKLYEIYKNL